MSAFVPGWRTWNDGKSCAHCCTGDRCDDPSHYDRYSKPGCPHCLNTGYALWTEAGQNHKAEHEARYAAAMQARTT